MLTTNRVCVAVVDVVTTVPVIKLAFVVAVNTTLAVPLNATFVEVITPSTLKFRLDSNFSAVSLVPYIKTSVPVVPIVVT